MEVFKITELFFKYKSWILPIFSIFSLVLVLFLFFNNDEDTVEVFKPIETIEKVEASDNSSVEKETEEKKTVFVEVKGAVRNPGVFELPSDGRVKNIIELAEPTDEADLKTINQAEKLKDEMVIYVPKIGEEVSSLTSTADKEEKNDVVNINTATLNELTTLNGIGEKKAEAIITYREENGLFMKVEDLLNIPGIGEKTLENLKPYITIGD